MQRALIYFSLALLSANAYSQQEAIPAPSLADYSRFQLRPVRSMTQVHPAVYGKFSAAVARSLDSYLSRWALAEHDKPHGKRLIFEILLTDAKFVSGQKRFWVGPLAGSSHCAATVELIDEETNKVIARQYFTQAAGAMAGTFTIGASDNRMITALAQKASNFIIASYSFQPAGSKDGSTATASTDEDQSESESSAAGDGEPGSKYDELIKLDELRRRGILTEDEFKAEKKKILDSSNTP